MEAQITIGIDLASGARDTAACLIDWASTPARLVTPPSANLGDEQIVDLAKRPGVVKIAIDAPLAWPMSFVESVRTYADSGRWPDLSPDELRFRATEHAVRAGGAKPIASVTDKLGWTTIRCARLLSRLSSSLDQRIDRSGQGLVVEAYPAAALSVWGLPGSDAAKVVSYKSAKNSSASAQERWRLIEVLRERLDNVLVIGDEDAEACVASDHAFDALICSLVARCSFQGLVEPIPEGMSWMAEREGWICVPQATALGGALVDAAPIGGVG